MSMIQNGTDFINEIVLAMSKVVPSSLILKECGRIEKSEASFPIEVSIGVTGDFKGEISVRTTTDFFFELALKMYGMQIPDDMLESFAGEMLNMVAGNLCTLFSEKGYQIDITVPTVRLEVNSYYSVNPIWLGKVEVDGTPVLNILLTYVEK